MDVHEATVEEVGKWAKEHLHQYQCDMCEENFYLEKVEMPSEIQCPYCGSDVAINSYDYRYLDI